MTQPSLDTALADAAQRIIDARAQISPRRAALIAVSGIDGSGKGYITSLIERELTTRGLRVANINIDGWLQLPDKRFDPMRPAEHFYESGVRFRELFTQLVLPLRVQRAVDFVAQHADATNSPQYFPHRYSFTGIDIILVEGIFLLRRELRRHFDFALWIDCTFDTALERALARNQEGLPEDDIVRAYAAIYFAAQKLHMQRDNPRVAANLVITNDHRLSTPSSLQPAAALP